MRPEVQSTMDRSEVSLPAIGLQFKEHKTRAASGLLEQPPLRTRAKQRQTGQAMVEFIVISGVLIAFYFGILYVGKYHSLQANTIQAARYATWERTVNTPANFSDTKLAEQVRARVFGWDQQALKADDALAANQAWKKQHAFNYDHTQNQSLLPKPGDITLNTSEGALPGSAAATISATISEVSGALGSITGGEKLNQGGLVQAQVQVKLAKISSLPAPFNDLQLNLTEKSALVTDSWDARDSAQTANRTRSFTPAAVFTRIDGLLSAVRWALSILEPSFSNFNPGQICPEIVPADRLDAGSALPVYRGGGQCY